MTEHNIFTPEEVEEGLKTGKIDPNLPPPGAARREELAKREDKLAEELDAATENIGRIPEHVLDPDREIRYDISKNYLEIGSDHPYLKTKWVNYINQNGSKVWEAKAEGWQVATAEEFPEARHLMREDNTIRVGDVLLLCIRMDQYLQIQKRQEEKRLRQQYGIETDIVNLAAKHPDAFPNVHLESTGGVPDHLDQKMQARAGARRVVAAHLGNKMKRGK